MNKQLAIEAMKAGARVSHRLFDNHEWMMSDSDGAIFRTEDRVSLTSKEFWDIRKDQMDEWNEGWEIVPTNPQVMSGNYRDRWTTLPEGEFDLHEGELVDLIYNPGMGSLTVITPQ